MDAQQCVKLSLTNRSIGLIVLIDQWSSCGQRPHETLFSPHADAFLERFAAEGTRHMARRPFGLAEASPPSGARRRIGMF